MTSYGPGRHVAPDAEQTAYIPRHQVPAARVPYRPWPYVLVKAALFLLAFVIFVGGVAVLTLFWGAQ